MEQLRNVNDKEYSKFVEKNLSQYHFVDRKSHINMSGIKAGSPRREACDQHPTP
jgi:hypothetical protein